MNLWLKWYMTDLTRGSLLMSWSQRLARNLSAVACTHNELAFISLTVIDHSMLAAISSHPLVNGVVLRSNRLAVELLREQYCVAELQAFLPCFCHVHADI
jgi:hypothetical protein